MTDKNKAPDPALRPEQEDAARDANLTDNQTPPVQPEEIGGPKGPEPTRYGDWEVGGICSDF